MPARLDASVRLLVGPANFAGQGTRWARALEERAPGVKATSFAFSKGVLDYPVDYGVPARTYRRNPRWRVNFYNHVVGNYTHVLIEASRSLFGPLYGPDGSYEIRPLLHKGLHVGLIAHGSDVRIPSRHVEIEPWSPFPDIEDEHVELLERNATRAVELFTSYPGPVYVSTPDLLDYVPNAVWCPVIVDVDTWRSNAPVLEHDKPVVAHAPSKSAMKGSELIDPIMERLAERGLITYRRVEGVDPADMPAVYRDADIVLDQFRVGSYGVAACEAMAAGRVVVGHIAQHVRDRVTADTGLELPIVGATPDTVEQVVLDLIAHPEKARETAARGPAFVEQVHDGRWSADALAPFVEEPKPVPAGWRPSWIRPKVVMMAGNDIVSDSRVLKYAQTVANWDLDVTCIGLPGRRLRGVRQFGKVQVMCPPIPSKVLLTGWRKRVANVKASLKVNFKLFFSTEAEYLLAYSRWQYASRELRAERGRDHRDRERIGAESGVRRSVVDRVRRAARWRTLRLHRAVLQARAYFVRRPKPDVDLTDLGIGRRRQLLLALHRRLPSGRWRRVMPEVVDQELTLGPLLDRLLIEVIHVHDVFMLGIAARAAHRAALDGRTIKIIYDAHEYIPGVPVVAPRRVAAYSDLEREFIRDADRVITVSEPLAHWLQRDHKLAGLPAVVLNAPVEPPEDADVKGLRDLLQLSEGIPLLVYGGGVNRARGVGTAVEALPQLPDVHLAIVARPNSVTAELQARAAELGVSDRVHLAPFVAAEVVPLYLRSASIGLSPLLHAPNHDIAVTNKFCEYIAAGLPIITSDTPAQADLVNELDLGAVYTAGDVDGLVQAVLTVLADRDRIAKRIAADPELLHRFSWAAQAEVIRSVYADILEQKLPAAAYASGATTVRKLLPGPPELPETNWRASRRAAAKSSR
ncbi:glycosyltransferase [Kribbella shirazensis]|uniref:Glycosyltransferase involved in cell wall biosynthesis n=1 Tax=Kribbella shirazensis TaxID=1105143 RepID=A0A7X5V928_9ACTN|nr:glycosyltransferase [Kribbella shirazensis]NIK56818.1 glycosyltransferase involved in cell wall biosynthesis [Kribbella shirazensis]